MDSGEQQAPGPGMVLGHFVIDEEIGAGAMGSVFKGTDRRDASHVAIKLLNPELSADPSFRQRFEREAHLATLLKSPYTVRVLDFGRSGRWYYIIMEFVEGESVSHLLANGPLPLQQALEIATDAARALEALSTQNIVHRDLKPGNLIVNPDGATKLVDFGISQQAKSRDRHAVFVGTVQYAAPEQQEGRADSRSDIYALGATLFHMLAGRPPYTGRTDEEILRQHMHAPFPAPLLSWHPEPVVDVVRRCMQKDPEDRYASASDLAAALDRLMARLASFPQPAVRPGGVSLIPEPEEDDQPSGATLVLAPRGVTPIPLPPHLAPEPEEDLAHPGTVVFPAPGTVPPMSTTPPTIAPAPTVAPPLAAPESAFINPPTVTLGTPPPPPPKLEAPAPFVPPPEPQPAAGGGGKGKLLVIVGLALFFVIGGGVVALLLLGGGGKDDKAQAGGATATSAASSPAVGGASPTAGAASPKATETATATASATETATATPPPTATPTEAPTATPAPPTPTATRAVVATQPPAATPTPVPAGASLRVVGFLIGGTSASAPSVGPGEAPLAAPAATPCPC